MPTMPLTNAERARLRRFLERRFNLGELKKLTFDLGVDFELFRHDTKTDFCRELVDYFERRDRLSCLIIEVLKHRDDRYFAELLRNLLPCSPRKKVQLVVSDEMLEMVEDRPELLSDLAKLFGIRVDEVALNGGASSSLRLLIDLPETVADLLVSSEIENIGDGKWSIIAVNSFDQLDSVSQEAWRLVACEWPLERRGDVLLPTISWKDALKEIRRRRSTQAAPKERRTERQASSGFLRWLAYAFALLVPLIVCITVYVLPRFVASPVPTAATGIVRISPTLTLTFTPHPATWTPTGTSALAPTPTDTPTWTPTGTSTLTPTPTDTPTWTPTGTGTLTPTPTDTNTPIPTFPPPDLEPVGIIACNVTFRWDWSRTLADDEWFDLRLERVKDEPFSITWTKEKEHIHPLRDAGEYRWHIVVIRGEPGTHGWVSLAESEWSSFWFRGCQIPSPTP